MSYFELEDAIFELKSVRNLLEIVLENVFDEESSEISSWAMRYDSVLCAAMRSVDNEIKRVGEIFDTLHEANQKKLKSVQKDRGIDDDKRAD